MRPDIALLYVLLRLLGLLPLRVLHALGAGLGRLMARGNGRLSWYTEVSLRLVRPSWDEARYRTGKREVLQHA
ncbi:MAG: lipid A biosynthesis acyltransferase, partial [Rhodanobacteraceae bacterium]